MKNVNRMGVFIFYDASGIVDRYVDVLLDSMRTVLRKLVIIVNGGIRDKEYHKLVKYSQDIFVRKNVGFDAGGYKDAFTEFLTPEELTSYDEIVLFNDTFYGPLYPWIDVFNIMEKEKIDFWGLSRHPGGKLQGGIVAQHIQSFFLVCRKALFESKNWTEFWNGLEYPKNVWEAISNFEVRFSEYFTQNGFVCKAFTDLKCASFEYDTNPYLDYGYELIKFARFPIIKKKMFSLRYLLDAKQSLDYIADKTNYDINLIYLNLKRLRGEGVIDILDPFNEAELDKFYNKHKNIFIYGHGYYGRGIEMYFRYKGWKHRGFLVTKKNETDNKVFAYDEIEFYEDDGVILALGKKALGEVYPIISRHLKISQLLRPVFK